MKKPDLLIPIAIWRFLAAFIICGGDIAIAVTQFPEVVQQIRVSEDFGEVLMVIMLFTLIIITLVMLTLGILSIAVGIGLIKGKSRGRVLANVFAVLDLLWIPIGTIIGLLSLMYLFRPEVKEYFKAASRGA